MKNEDIAVVLLQVYQVYSAAEQEALHMSAGTTKTGEKQDG